jgi:hypothetical protein
MLVISHAVRCLCLSARFTSRALHWRGLALYTSDAIALQLEKGQVEAKHYPDLKCPVNANSKSTEALRFRTRVFCRPRQYNYMFTAKQNSMFIGSNSADNGD